MMAKITFLLDANVFIEASHRYYAFDLAPRFWNSLVEHSKQGELLSIDRVKKELMRGKDELADWAIGPFQHAFVSTDDEVVTQAYSAIMRWVNDQKQFLRAAKADFADGADGWLIAYAKTFGYTVVTHEELAPDVRRRVPIPNVCRAFSVPYQDTFSMLRVLGIRFS